MTELSNPSGLAQVRAVENRACRSLCFHMVAESRSMALVFSFFWLEGLESLAGIFSFFAFFWPEKLMNIRLDLMSNSARSKKKIGVCELVKRKAGRDGVP